MGLHPLQFRNRPFPLENQKSFRNFAELEPGVPESGRALAIALFSCGSAVIWRLN